MEQMLELALLVKAGHQGLQRQINEAMRPLGISGPQSEAISVIGQAGPLSLKELGGLLVAESGHPSRLVDRLVAAGFVERRAHESDGRRIELTLTRRGRAMERRIADIRAQLIELGRAIVGDADLGPTLETLRELVATTPYADLGQRRRELEAGLASHGATAG